MNKLKNVLLIVAAFIGGAFASIFTTLAFAHGGDTNLIHGCVRSTLLPNAANIRIIGANENCGNYETALDWTKTASSSGSSDFVCVYCKPDAVMRRINQPTLTNYNFDNALFGENEWTNADISGSSFVYAVLKSVYLIGGTGVNTDFSNADLRGSSLRASADFEGAKFINTDMPGSTLTESSFINADFTNANLSYSFFIDSVVTEATFTDSNLANVDFTGANLTDAIGIDTATRTDVIWSNTICPDGTNSDSNSNTCEGHLTP